MQDYRTPTDHCPKCNCLLDTVTNMTGQGRPEIGDFSICIGCAELLRFGPSLTVYQPSSEELRSIPKQDFHDLMKARLAVTMYLQRVKK